MKILIVIPYNEERKEGLLKRFRNFIKQTTETEAAINEMTEKFECFITSTPVIATDETSKAIKVGQFLAYHFEETKWMNFKYEIGSIGQIYAEMVWNSIKDFQEEVVMVVCHYELSNALPHFLRNTGLIKSSIDCDLPDKCGECLVFNTKRGDFHFIG